MRRTHPDVEGGKTKAFRNTSVLSGRSRLSGYIAISMERIVLSSRVTSFPSQSQLQQRVPNCGEHFGLQPLSHTTPHPNTYAALCKHMHCFTLLRSYPKVWSLIPCRMLLLSLVQSFPSHRWHFMTTKSDILASGQIS
jgi:hypothetical protein